MCENGSRKSVFETNETKLCTFGCVIQIRLMRIFFVPFLVGIFEMFRYTTIHDTKVFGAFEIEKTISKIQKYVQIYLFVWLVGCYSFVFWFKEKLRVFLCLAWLPTIHNHIIRSKALEKEWKIEIDVELLSWIQYETEFGCGWATSFNTLFASVSAPAFSLSNRIHVFFIFNSTFSKDIFYDFMASAAANISLSLGICLLYCGKIELIHSMVTEKK